MRNRFVLWIATLVAVSMLGCGIVWAQADEDDDDDEPTAADANPQFPWPAQFSVEGQSFTVYPPELERWNGDQLQARAAIAVQGDDDVKPTYGVAELTARVHVDAATQLATLGEIRVARINFPTAAQNAPRYLEILGPRLAALHWQLPADQLRADLAVDRAAHVSHTLPVRNEAPAIVFSDRPTILVPIDGVPVMREMVGLGLKRVLNTRALILQDRESDRYFIYAAGRWMESRTLEGPWNDAQIRPSTLDEAKAQAQSGGQVDLLDADNRASGTTRLIVSTKPTELVQTEGPPQYLPVTGTQLLYVTNTPNRLFLDLRTQQYYVLLSGRWFRANALDQGRWEYVAGSALPGDFAAIPDSHPTATVRESVPGTPEADEAAIANSVPQVATVKRSEARLDLTYDGSPQFKPIEGTALGYAVNADIPVIRIDDRNYYALDDGVWFFSATMNGPWSPASYVPPVIYSIPVSSPLHYVTYVRVYGATSDSLSVGYSPGYVGSYVTSDNTVVYGSGYYYRPWVGTVWYPYPVTWGFGFSYWNTWWNPWHVRPWWAYRAAPHYHPWWGPWHRPFVGARVARGPGPAQVVVQNRPRAATQVNVTNVTNIYRRWGHGVAAPHPALAQQASRSRAAAAANPVVQSNGQMFRQRDGHWQRATGNGQWEASAPPPEHTRRQVVAPAAVAPVVPAAVAPAGPGAPVTGQTPVITTPRPDRRVPSDGANANRNMQQGNGQRSIVGPTPGIAGPTPGIATPPPISNPARNSAVPPGGRPIVGPPPGIQAPQSGGVVGHPGGGSPPDPRGQNTDSAANAPHDGRHGQGERGRARVVIPDSPSHTPPVQRQHFEQRSAAPVRPVPVPAPVTPLGTTPRSQQYQGMRGGDGPPVNAAPGNGRTTGRWRDNHDAGGHR
jgi:hypothetical protein